MDKQLQQLRRFKDFAPLFIRVPVGWRLVDGTQDNVFSWERMLEFRDFLANFGYPFPLASAMVSVYAQFLCGIMFILGLKVQWAAAVMVINFTIALLTVHLNDTYQGAFQAITMLFCSLFLLFNGAGKWALKD